MNHSFTGGKLRNRIMVMMVLVSLVPTTAGGFLSIYNISVTHEKNIADTEESFLNERAGRIKKFFDDIFSVLHLHVGFEQTDEIKLSSQVFLLDQMMAENKSLEEISFVNMSGQETSRFLRDEERPSAELRNQSKMPWLAVVRGGDAYTSEPYVTRRGTAVYFAVPVENKNGIIISFIAGELNISEVVELVNSSRLGDSGYLILADPNGFMLAGGPDSKGMQYLGKNEMYEQVLSGTDATGPQGQRRYVSYWGEKTVAVGVYLPQIYSALFLEWPVREADEIVNGLIYRTILMFLLIFVSVLVVGLFLANFIVRPIKKLEQGTGLVAQGKFDKPVEITTGDELEELGNSFNKMMDGLKQLRQLKDEFVFVAAHELRTPVTAIKGYLSMIEDGTVGPVTPEIKEFVHKVIDANQRLIQLVNDLLQVARSDAGRMEIKVEPSDIPGAINLVLGELKPLALEKQITVTYKESTSLPRVLADTLRLKEVMINLVGNAIKYTPAGGRIEVFHEVKNKELITSIKDNGYGISKEAQQKLFEKFYRVQTDKTRDITGTGLGLFIVKQIMDKMNGRIWVESEEGQGSTFNFSLPLA
ncbi:MAG: sensor histidine kinase [Candidatus Liptonbacteria bacterium]